MKRLPGALLLLAVALPARACIWDADTLASEQRKSPDMAALILGTRRTAPDTNALLRRIETLKAKPREGDPGWWNDLAGAHLRLGNAQATAELLEPLLVRFPNEYGIHANLGTAYHLLGRYVDAEREIARDLELNTNAHFGLEVYHLALLQYLSRSKYYQSRHAYVDEFTPLLLGNTDIIRPYVANDLASWNLAGTLQENEELEQVLADRSLTNATVRTGLLLQLASLDPPPAYRLKWNLAHHRKFNEGVRYMAELNQNEPACFVMLGLASLHAGDLNLGARAFERAIQLDSPQRELLQSRIAEINRHIAKAKSHRRGVLLPLAVTLLVGCTLVCVSIWLVRRLMATREVPR